MEQKSIAPEQYTNQLAALAGFINRACAFTGHRPQKLPWRSDKTAPGCVELKETLAAQIAALVEDGYTEFLTGMAEGVDIWAAQIVLSLRVTNPSLRLHCILPCAEQSVRWSVASQEQHHAILEQADSIIFVNRADKKNCMLERDHFLVSYASLVLAVYNGEKRGGTAATVRYAQKLGRKLIVIDPVTLTVTREEKQEAAQ